MRVQGLVTLGRLAIAAFAVTGLPTLQGCGGGAAAGGGAGITSYQIGGTVGGLVGSGLVLKNNGADALAISANGSFTFPVAVAAGASFAVTVGTQPSGPAQVCTVSGGSGTVGSANVTGVAVNCMRVRFEAAPQRA